MNTSIAGSPTLFWRRATGPLAAFTLAALASPAHPGALAHAQTQPSLTRTGGPAGGETRALLHLTAAPGTGTPRTFAGAGDSAYTSTDAGLLWSFAGDGLSGRVLALTGNSERLIAATQRRGVRSSTDSATWSDFGDGLPGAGVVPTLRLAARAGSALALLTPAPGVEELWTRPFSGETPWQRLDNAPTFLGDFAVTSTGRIVVGGLFEAAVSDDGGTTFSPRPLPGGFGFPFAQRIAADNTRVLVFAAAEGTLYRSSDNAQTFSPALPGLPAGPVNALSAAAGTFFATVDTRLFRSADGAVWTATFGLPLSPSLGEVAAAGNTLLIGTPEGVYASTDGGATWFPRVTGIDATRIDRVAADPTTPDQLYAVSSRAPFLYHSPDSGTTWLTTPFPALPAAQPRALVTLASGTLIVGTFTDGLFRSTDRAQTLDAIAPDFPRYNGTGGAQFREADHLAALGETLFVGTGTSVERTGNEPPGQQGFSLVGAGIFRSNNAGTSFTPASSGLPSLGVNLSGTPLFEPITALRATGPTALVAGTFTSGPFTSADSGTTWSALGSGLPTCEGALPNLVAFAVAPGTGELLAAADGFNTSGLCSLPSPFFRLAGGVWSDAAGNLPAGLAAADALAIGGEVFASLVGPTPDTPGTGVYGTADAGRTWRFVGTPQAAPPLGLALARGRLVLGTAGAGVWLGPPACAADFDNNGILNPDDLSDFITEFFLTPPGPRADFDNNGITNPDDLADFIAAFFLGCN